MGAVLFLPQLLWSFFWWSVYVLVVRPLWTLPLHLGVMRGDDWRWWSEHSSWTPCLRFVINQLRLAFEFEYAVRKPFIAPYRAVARSVRRWIIRRRAK